jgi:hypothetical protein
MWRIVAENPSPRLTSGRKAGANDERSDCRISVGIRLVYATLESGISRHTDARTGAATERRATTITPVDRDPTNQRDIRFVITDREVGHLARASY